MSASARLPDPVTIRLDSATTLRAAAVFWFLVVLVGQLCFAVAVAAFYGRAAGRGDYEAWNRVMTHGYVPGEPLGNVMVAIHLVAAVLVILGGALQLIPGIRGKAPWVHRWNGRLYLVAAFAVSLAGLDMIWTRGAVGTVWEHVGQSLDGVLVMLFAGFALRQALAPNFRAHGRWAVRLYLAVSASLFIRASFVLTIPLGLDQGATTGPFLTTLSYGQFVVPLAVYELYWRIRDNGGAAPRVAMACGLIVLTLVLGAGIAAATMSLFVPEIALAYEDRASVAEPVERALAQGGLAEARRRFEAIRITTSREYDLSEPDLNGLGYKLLSARRWPEAIGIFELNVESYPRSGNVYDSLAEAYMDSGDTPRAIAFYERSLTLTPGNANALRMLRRLGAR
ncbi:DUF2306 domain-containing protein [Lichenicoccus sp.]|uniref:DUF2306 domain-containing protein n=1 Tax=Lichenicoccus sp. TaxID=2781899 RepID=UPI003D0D3222